MKSSLQNRLNRQVKMYYLFIKKNKNLQQFKEQLEKVQQNMKEGRTPVYNEVRAARNDLIEAIPFNVVKGFFMIVAALILGMFPISDTIKVAVVLVINRVCANLASFVFVSIKHFFRIRLCKRLGLEPTEQVIAAMESLEYQSV